MNGTKRFVRVAAILALGLGLGGGGFGSACGGARSSSPASSLEALRDLERSPTVQAARVDLPDGFARGVEERARAEEAARAGDRALVDHHAEMAAIAFRQVVAASRTSAAHRRVAAAHEAAERAQAEVHRFESERREVESQVEQRLRERAAAEALEAERTTPSGAPGRPAKRPGATPPAAPNPTQAREREAARRVAARGLLAEARLFLTAAAAVTPADGAASPARDHLALARRALDEATLAEARGDVSLVLDGAGRAREEAALSIRTAAADGARTEEARTERAHPDQAEALFSAASQTAAFEARRDPRGVVVTLRGLFAGRTSTMGPGAAALLAPLARLVRQFAGPPAIPIVVEGYVDEPMPRDAVTRLSAARAEAVAAELRRAGTPADRIRTAGVGSDAPIAPAGSPEGRALNTRIEVVFVLASGR